MYDHPLTITQNLELLAAGPARIADLSAGLSPVQLVTAPEPSEWSARDLLAHLRACSDMWGKYIALILNEDHPTFKAVNPTTWIEQTDYRQQAFPISFQAYQVQRLDLLALLEPLPPEAWARAATVTGAGKPRERTVASYAMWLANHERSHFRQFANIAKAFGTSQTDAPTGKPFRKPGAA